MDKLMRGAVVVGLIVALLQGPASMPLQAAPGTRASLQAGAFDPGVLDTVARGVAVTAGVSSQGAPSAVAGDLGSLISGRPTPVPEGAQNTDVAGLEEYSSGGITLTAPADWDVIEGGFSSLFDISVPGSEFSAVLQDGGGDFPGMIMVVFFAGIPELLLGEFLQDGTLTSVEFSQTSQQLPMVAVHFDRMMDEVEGSGVMYVISPGETVYVFIAFASTDEWETLSSQVQQVAESITFDDNLLTLVTAENGELVYSDNENVQVTIPEGWHVSNTNDESLLVLVTNPDYRFAMAIGTDAGFDEGLGSGLEDLSISPEDEIDAETQAMVFDLIMQAMGDGSDFVVDESLNAVYPHEGGVTFRVVGAGDFSDGANMPVAVYLDLRTDGGLISMLLGDVDSALEVEPQVLEIINSVELLQ